MMNTIQRMLFVHSYLFSLRHEVEQMEFMGTSAEKRDLFTPSLKDVATELNNRLTLYFKTVDVDVVECPDLHQPPYCFAARGLCGQPMLVEVGGPTYLIPKVDRSKVYDFRDIQRVLNINPCYFMGAGAGPFPYTEVNCEGIYNVMIDGSVVKQRSKISKINVNNGTSEQQDLPNTETRFALLANLFVSQGLPGEVLKIHVKERIGCHDFIASIRNCLKDAYSTAVVGLGGVFLMKSGTFRQHVMPDFATDEIKSEEQLNGWLRFYNMSAPLVAVGTLVTGDMDLDLRLQHFHSSSDHNEAGHYHNDITPETVEYLAYFNIANSVVRIDKPKDSHDMGRD
ncbi:ester hydrolase C11orf54 homolog [Onthophagus taurus]|uniref:ester hydrolase C11orf54 homolog n=1 Tax=Onthophagus taurus TaxID=166361 RepID=UPI0039BDF58C